MELEEGAVPCIGINQQDRVRQVLGQQVRVSYGYHRIAHAVDHETRLRDPPEVGETLPVHLLPCPKRGYLRLGHGGARLWLPILGARSEPRRERLPCGLARLAAREEELDENPVAGEAGIAEDLAELRLLQVHDVLAT